MVRRRGLARGPAAAAAAAAALCLTFHPQSAVVALESIRGGGAAGANDTNFDLKSGKPRPRKSLDAPRSAEGIRKRLAAGIGTTPIEQDVPGSAVSEESSTESQDHVATGTCKRKEGWKDDGSTLGAGDICCVGEALRGPHTHKGAHQGRGREQAGQRSVGPAEEGRTETPLVPDDDRLGLRHLTPTSREINGIKESRGLSTANGIADTPNSNGIQPAPEHNPWEGYQIVAEADPVASWEILREVSHSRAMVRVVFQLYRTHQCKAPQRVYVYCCSPHALDKATTLIGLFYNTRAAVCGSFFADMDTNQRPRNMCCSPRPHGTHQGAVELLHLQVRSETGATAAGSGTNRNGQAVAGGFLDVHAANDVAQRVSIEGGRRAQYRLDISLRAHGGSHSGTYVAVGVRMVACLRSFVNNTVINVKVFSLPTCMIQELNRRYDALDTNMDVLKAETQNGGWERVLHQI